MNISAGDAQKFRSSAPDGSHVGDHELWGTTQTGISKLDEDFQGYADLWFGRGEHVTDFRWDQWLKDVAA